MNYAIFSYTEFREMANVFAGSSIGYIQPSACCISFVKKKIYTISHLLKSRARKNRSNNWKTSLNDTNCIFIAHWNWLCSSCWAEQCSLIQYCIICSNNKLFSIIKSSSIIESGSYYHLLFVQTHIAHCVQNYPCIVNKRHI